MQPHPYQSRLINLLPDRDPPIPESLRSAVANADVAALDQADRHFAIVTRQGQTVRMARTLGRPMRYFLAKRFDGPFLIVAERMDSIRRFAVDNGLGEQFDPMYTRMVPAHYVLELQLRGCPDPNPTHTRFFTPERNTLSTDIEAIGRHYIEATQRAIRGWLEQMPADQPVGVAFSGGIDSTAILILTRRVLEGLGRPADHLKAFTLAFGGEARDAAQATEVAQRLGLADRHEIITGDPADLDPTTIVRLVEDYHPLDIQCAAMNHALCAAIRQRYPDWTLLLDGDGGDENLKDYSLEGTDITPTSVLDNLMLYQEGWGVDSIKHSLVYSGGLSRSYTRTFVPPDHFGFSGFSPFTLPSVIRVAEAIPFVELTQYDSERLYALKGRVVAAGIRQVTGIEMPVADKRRFQEGALAPRELDERLPLDKPMYRRLFDRLWDRSLPEPRAATIA